MKVAFSPIVSAEDLLAIYKTENILLVDASNGQNSEASYTVKHLDGAIFIDSSTQLATIQPDAAIGGRHPLPTIEDFSQTLGNLGITPQTRIVVYDDKNGANAAARFWWMLQSIGHKKVQVLDGGIQAAERIGFPVNCEEVVIPKTPRYPCVAWQLPLSSIEEVERVAQTTHTVIDVREAYRYNGESEPIDTIAGHIPGAINLPFTQNLDENGFFLSPIALREKYLTINPNHLGENTIVHCGSGITACHTLLAMYYAGLPIAKLYVGSWSEWSRNKKLIVTNDITN